MDARYTLSVEHTPRWEEVQFLRKALSDFNRRLVGGDDYQPLAVLLRDANGTIVGGLFGVTYWGWLYTEVLWVSEAVRRQGLGRALLAAAEQEAVRRGCPYAHVDTMSFQALAFYQKQGYVVFGELHDVPAGSGHTRYFLKKELPPA